MKNKIVIGLTLAVTLAGCSSYHQDLNADDVDAVSYEYTIDNTSQYEIYNRALDYFSISLGDSKPVIHSQNPENGQFEGKGLVDWKLRDESTSDLCLSYYDIQFKSEENKATLQLKLIDGTPNFSKCTQLTSPSVGAYNDDVIAEFNDISEELAFTLKASQTN